MSKLFVAFAFALLLLPGFARAEEPCHQAQDGKAESGPVAANGVHGEHAHHAAHASGVEEVPQTVKKDCPHHPGIVHTCSTQLALMKCGMHGCCIKTEEPVADGGSPSKGAPEIAIDGYQRLNPFSLKGLVSPYLLEKLSNHYPPVPRPPSA